MTQFYPLTISWLSFDLLHLNVTAVQSVMRHFKLYIWLIFCLYQIQAFLVSEASKVKHFPDQSLDL